MLKRAVRRFFIRNMRLSRRILISGSILVIVLTFLNLFEKIEHGSSTKVNLSLCPKIDKNELENISSNLKVQVFVSDVKAMIIQITNIGAHDIISCYWEIYFSLIAVPLTPLFASYRFKVDHVNGFLFKMYPDVSKGFNALLRAGEIEVIKVSGHLMAKCYVFPNWLVTGPDLDPLVISSTSREYQDMVSINPILTSKSRFNTNRKYAFFDAKINSSNENFVIPTPLQIIGRKEAMEYISISPDWLISYNDDSLIQEAKILQKFLRVKKISLNFSTGRRKFVIALQIIKKDKFHEEWMDAVSYQPGMKHIFESHEAYKLLTFNHGIVLQATTSTGIFYGIQTIISLCRKNISVNGNIKLMPFLNITDAPRYKYRGLMLDVARHFLDVGFVKKMITLMSSYKMNHLHLHLTDDEGWRIEIPDIPELISVGADPTVKYKSKPKFDFLNAYLGNRPAGEWNHDRRQHYTSDEYIDILSHAAKHHVTVVPEIDFPGHSHAALVSMRARGRGRRYNDGGVDGRPDSSSSDNNNDNNDGFYIIEDEKDTSDDASINKVSDTVINFCRRSTISFMRVIVTTMISYHEQAGQPLQMIHLGGDEVSDLALRESPICQKIFKGNSSLLRSLIVEQLLQFGSEHKVKVILWESNNRDSHFENPQKPIVHFWLPSTGREEIVLQYIKDGSDVILSESNVFYLDHPYEACTHEQGLRWAARSINEFDIFQYSPPNVCQKVEDNCQDILKHIIGIQANLWGELILQREDAEHMLFPRLLSVAERAWRQSSWQQSMKYESWPSDFMDEWLSFASAVTRRELPVLENLDVKYRIPPPGARFSKNGLEYNTLLPNLPVMMSNDGGVTWFEGKKLEKNGVLAAKSGKRFSRMVKVD